VAWARVGPLKTWDKLMKCLGELAETDGLACRGCLWDLDDGEAPQRGRRTRAEGDHASSRQKKRAELWSSLDRHLKGHPAELHAPIEQIIAERFVQRAPDYLLPAELRLPDEPVGLLTLMRHYVAPTRLLDWTESVWIAPYFACSGGASESSGGNRAKERAGAIWVFDRFLLDDSVRNNCQAEVEEALQREPDTGSAKVCPSRIQ